MSGKISGIVAETTGQGNRQKVKIVGTQCCMVAEIIHTGMLSRAASQTK